MRKNLVIPTAIISLFGSAFLCIRVMQWLGISEVEIDSARHWVYAFSILVSYLAANAMEGSFIAALDNILGLIISIALLSVLMVGLYYLWSSVPVWAFFIILLLTLILIVLVLIWSS